MTLVAVLMAELPARRKGGWRTRAERGLPPLRKWADELYARGIRAQDYRRSYANVWRRLERGQTPVVCPTCGCETDVAVPAHDNRCDERESE